MAADTALPDPRGHSSSDTTTPTAPPTAMSSMRISPTCQPVGWIRLKTISTIIVNAACPAANDAISGTYAATNATIGNTAHNTAGSTPMNSMSTAPMTNPSGRPAHRAHHLGAGGQRTAAQHRHRRQHHPEAVLHGEQMRDGHGQRQTEAGAQAVAHHHRARRQIPRRDVATASASDNTRAAAPVSGSCATEHPHQHRPGVGGRGAGDHPPGDADRGTERAAVQQPSTHLDGGRVVGPRAATRRCPRGSGPAPPNVVRRARHRVRRGSGARSATRRATRAAARRPATPGPRGRTSRPGWRRCRRAPGRTASPGRRPRAPAPGCPPSGRRGGSRCPDSWRTARSSPTVTSLAARLALEPVRQHTAHPRGVPAQVVVVAWAGTRTVQRARTRPARCTSPAVAHRIGPTACRPATRTSAVSRAVPRRSRCSARRRR